ncbi:tRNA lysidine(34) synthetase TilS [Aquabacter sp. CN5-332]|uniref:tRNA lysidine(34) synthetase TilS n=1 Tax=Aquabacter sp. CN5-332 TaxID=3156608 RepID=UPI0032B5BC43
MLLAQAWRVARSHGPTFLVATVDHALRADSAGEAKTVARLCRRLKLPHETLVWAGEKPSAGIQEAARAARYALLTHHARANGATALVLAHTRDDQAETVLFRLARGSGLSGLSAMRHVSQMGDLALLRPLLDIPKARLIAATESAGVTYARDPSNTDPRFTRPRLRRLAPALAAEGLDAKRLALLARRVARAEAALVAAAAQAAARCTLERAERLVRLDPVAWSAEPDEISLRILLDALSSCATEGDVELAKAERLHEGLLSAVRAEGRLSRTLAGVLVTLEKGRITFRPAPERRLKTGSSRQIHPEPDTRPWQARARHLD